MDFDVARLRSSTICASKLAEAKKLETPEERNKSNGTYGLRHSFKLVDILSYSYLPYPRLHHTDGHQRRRQHTGGSN